MKNKTPLIVFGLFLPLAFGAWQWSRVLEARFEKRLETPQRLQFKITKGGNKYFSMPSPNDVFTLTVGDFSDHKKGYESEDWKVKRLEFRASSTQGWNVLPRKFWDNNWIFFPTRAYMPTINGEQEKVFSVFNYAFKSELMAGQYRMRAQFDDEMHDDHSGFRYAGNGQFDFIFHVPPAPKGKKRVILDSVQKVG